MLSDGIRHIGDGLLEVTDERLQGILSPEDIADNYDVEKAPFARGKFATVRRVTHKKTGVHFAAKFLRRRRRAQCWAKDIGHEIAVLMLCCDSKHIVKLHAVHETKTEIALLLEMATGGELQAMLDDEGALTEEQTRICMTDILKALQYLHKKSIAHLDLKPQNILLAGEKIEDGLKLCDFGISRVVEEGGKIREILGTPDYVAPEVLQYEPLSLQTDIWSIGVLTYVLLTGCSPFGGDNKQETFLNISQCALTFPEELFDDVSPTAIDFIRSALRIKPNDRMTVSQCLEHRWITDTIPILRTIQTNLPTDVTTIITGATTTATTTDEDEEEEEELKEYELCKIKQQQQNGHHIKIEQQQNGGTIHNNKTDLLINNLQENNIDDDNKENNILIKYSNINKGREINLNHHQSETIKMMESLQQHQQQIQQLQQQLSGSSNNNNNNNNKGTTTTNTVITTTTIQLFPDAPTTPKVCRKATDSPPNVKALVKKFQLDLPAQQQTTEMHHLVDTQTTMTSATTTVTTKIHNNCIEHENTCCVDNYCCKHTRCLSCGPSCHHHHHHINDTRKSMGMIDQGIIC